jgi:hypothetical protein
VFLQQIQDKEVRPQYQDEAVFIKKIANGVPGKWVNQKGFEITSEFTPDNSHAYIGAGGANPGGGSNEYAKMYVGYARYRKSIEIDGDTYDDMVNGKDTTLVDFSQKVARVNASAIREQEEAAMGDGRGIKAVVGSGSSTSSIVLTTTQTLTPLTSKGSQFLYKNHVYDLYDSSNNLRQANIRLTAVTYGSSPTATPDATLSVTPASTDYLVLAGSQNKVFRGLPYLIDNSNTLFQGLLPSAYQHLKSAVEDLNGKPIQPSTIMRLRNKVKYRKGIEKAKRALLIFGSLAQTEAYARTGINFLQLGVGQTWDGTVNSIKMGDGEIMESTTAEEGNLWFINKDDLKKIEKRPWGFIKDGDGRTFRQKQGSNGTGANSIYANLGVDMNFYVCERNSHAVIKRAATSDVATEATSW